MSTQFVESGRSRQLVGFMAIVAFASTYGCGQNATSPIVSKPSTFDDHFELVDTIVLDTSFVIGALSSLDVDPDGHLLAGNRMTSELALYLPDGTRIRELTVDDCAPGFQNPFEGKFVFDGSRIVAHNLNVAFLFDNKGVCQERLEDFKPMWSFCSTQDSLFALLPRRNPSIISYSKDFKQATEYKLETPRFPAVFAVSRGLGGRELSCTDGDVTYFYNEEPDVRHLRGSTPAGRHEPYGYSPIDWFPENHSGTADLSHDLMELRKRSDMSIGNFDLENGYRIMVFENWREGTRKGDPTMLYNLIDKSRPDQSYSFATDKWPLATRNGLLYVIGGSDTDASDATNPKIAVYRMTD